MILRQIGHNCHLDRHAFKLMLMNRMARKFHYYKINMRFLGAAEESLHYCCARDSSVQFVASCLPGNLNRCGTKHRCRIASLFENFIQVINCRCFAVRASYSDDAKMFRWIAISHTHQPNAHFAIPLL